MAKFFGFEIKRKNLSKKVAPLTAEGRKRQDEAILEKTKRWKANQLLYCAWAIEICAASIGFFFAFVTANATRKYLTDNSFIGNADIDVFLAGLPFVIIGVVELTKIPLAFAAYNAKASFWKVLFVGALLSLCLITGETIFTGMERSLDNQLKYFAEDKKRQEEIIDEISNLEEKVLVFSQERGLEYIDAEYNADRLEFNEEYDKAFEDLNSDREDRLSELEDREKNLFIALTHPSDAEDLEKQLNIVLDRIKSKEALLADEIRSIREDTQRELDSINEQIDTHQKNLSNLRPLVKNDGGFRGNKNAEQVKQEEQLLLEVYKRNEAAKLSRSESINGLKEDNKQDIASDEQQRDDLQQNLSKARSKNEKTLKSNQALINTSREALKKRFQNRQDVIQAEYEEQKTLKEKNYKETRIRAEGIQLTLDNLKLEKEELESEKIQVENNIKDKAGEIQVMRFAATYAAWESNGERDDVEDVTQEDIGFVMLIWFGSIALIAATTGTVIAFASFYIRDPRNWKERYLDKLKRVTPWHRFLQKRREYYVKKINGEIKPGIFKSVSDALVRLIETRIKRLKEPIIQEKEVIKIKYMPVDQRGRTIGMNESDNE